MPDFNIRPVTENDLPDVLNMIRALARHHGDTPQLSLQDLSRDALGPAPWLTILVATQGAARIGYAALCPLIQLQFGARGMDMHHLFVGQCARGAGVGRALIIAAQEAARAQDCRYMTVGTHPDNAAAGAVYLASGFDRLPSPGPRFRIRL